MGKSSIIVLCYYLTTFSFSQAEEPSAAKFNLTSSSEFIEQKISVFSINERSLCPFGKPQDPNKKVIIRKPVENTLTPTSITKKEQQILIEQEITKLSKKMNVMGRHAIIGSKTYGRGDLINVSVKETVFPLKFNSITSGKVTFLDLTDKSIISLDMNNRSVIPRGGNSPIDIDLNKTETLHLDE